MNLIINSFGAVLQKENHLFLVVTDEGRQTFLPDKIKSISLGKSAKVSSDAIFLAIKHEIDILFVNDIGMPEGRVWSIKYGSISNIRRAQLNFIYSKSVIVWVKELIIEKINNQIALLLTYQPTKDEIKGYNLFKYAINSLNDYKNKIANVDATVLSDIAPSLRGWEGQASKKYFETLAYIMPEEYKYDNRSRMPAKDIFNAMLNYAYGMLYGKVEGALIKSGIDPYVGIFHRDEYNRPAMVFDFIEKFRLWMDYVVIQLCINKSIQIDLFSYDEITGACRLDSLAKRILIQSVNDYLAEIIELSGNQRSRQTHIDMEAQKLAQYFQKNA
jgi:CRISPR-associated protein Cas1